MASSVLLGSLHAKSWTTQQGRVPGGAIVEHQVPAGTVFITAGMPVESNADVGDRLPASCSIVIPDVFLQTLPVSSFFSYSS